MPKSYTLKERAAQNSLMYGRGAKKIPQRLLPTKEDVDLACEFYREKMTEDEAVDRVSQDILKAYGSLTSIKVSKKSVKNGVKAIRLRRLQRTKELSFDKRTGDMREGSGKKRKGKGKRHLPKVTSFSDWAKTLFFCPKEVQPSDLEFLNDQKGVRKLRRDPRVIPESFSSPGSPILDSDQLESDSDESESESPESQNDPDFVLEPRSKKQRSKKSLRPDLLDCAERYGLSNGALAATYNAASSDGTSYTIEGVRKARNKAREANFCPDISNFAKIQGIGVDERGDHTIFGGGDVHKEEHCSVITYHGDVEITVGYFVPENGTGVALANGLFLFCEERQFDLSSLWFLISDGCNKMKGWKSGFHAEFEKLVQKALVRIICFFHHFEKTFGKVFSVCGGQTTGPSTLTADWQQLIGGDIHKREIVNFKKIENSFVLSLVDQIPEGAKLSSDHVIFLALTETILTGKVSPKAHRKIGPMVHSRFTTSETRALSAYLRTVDPPDFLLRVVNYLVNVFAPVFCLGKIFYKTYFMGPRLLLLETMQCKKHLSVEELEAVSETLDENGQMCAHENILLCCLSSPDFNDRTLGVETILRIRHKSSLLPSEKGIRLFKPYDYRVNVKATGLDNLNMIPLREARYEPPVTKAMTESEILTFLHTPYDASGVPLSSVTVERAVKDVTRAAMMARNTKQRNGVIQMTIRSRAKDSKCKK